MRRFVAQHACGFSPHDTTALSLPLPPHTRGRLVALSSHRSLSLLAFKAAIALSAPSSAGKQRPQQQHRSLLPVQLASSIFRPLAAAHDTTTQQTHTQQLQHLLQHPLCTARSLHLRTHLVRLIDTAPLSWLLCTPIAGLARRPHTSTQQDYSIPRLTCFALPRRRSHSAPCFDRREHHSQHQHTQWIPTNRTPPRAQAAAVCTLHTGGARPR